MSIIQGRMNAEEERKTIDKIKSENYKEQLNRVAQGQNPHWLTKQEIRGKKWN